MSEHRATVRWTRTSDDFTYQSYNRAHAWTFEGGQSVQASAAPDFQGDAALANPEEAFIAALSSCHMLTLLAICAKKRIVVNGYTDDAVGHLGKLDDGRMAVTKVVLRPRIEFEGDAPAPEVLAGIHESAHHHCFIANSVTTDVTVEEPAPV